MILLNVNKSLLLKSVLFHGHRATQYKEHHIRPKINFLLNSLESNLSLQDPSPLQFVSQLLVVILHAHLHPED